jgi:hypothetical protein
MSSTLPSKEHFVLILTIFSAIALTSLAVPSFTTPSAFAEPGNSGLVVDPTIQTSVESSTNINEDNDVIFATGCADISDDDKVTQVNQQSAEQKVQKNNDIHIGGLVIEPTIQTSVQTATNINYDNDVFIVMGCDEGGAHISDNDEVTQVNQQKTDQEVQSDSEVGDGGSVISPTIQMASQTARNINQDDDRVIMIPLPKIGAPSDDT